MNRILFATVIFVIVFLFSCKEQESQQAVIRLKWNAATNTQTAADIQRGFSWALSLLGAEIPLESEDRLFRLTDSLYINLYLDSCGFSDRAKSTLQVICDSLKQSEEYKKHQAVDIGRFLVLTLHSPAHYYRITGVPSFETYQRRLESTPSDSFLVKNSSVAFTERKLLFSSAFTDSMMFTALENAGGAHGNFLEVFDVMRNGQFRFWMYDSIGNLAFFSPKTFGTAGSPSKCSWCHESMMQTLRTETPEVPGYMLSLSFNARMDSVQRYLADSRKKKNLSTHYERYDDHTLAELLYISFMEPSAYRLAREWEMSADEVKRRMKGCSTHRYPEFDFLGDLYDRKDADAHSPFKTKQVPESVREFSAFQPDYFK